MARTDKIQDNGDSGKKSRTPSSTVETQKARPLTVNDRAPNFREDGKLYLVRCFACSTGERGIENYMPAVASGQCAWCGWDESTNLSGKRSNGRELPDPGNVEPLAQPPLLSANEGHVSTVGKAQEPAMPAQSFNSSRAL